uniref:Uncharacterized protein n=1 Tax=viral metagenome TaxID=1070528 RepID=A0A6C0F2U4_9ZZZZ
MVWYNINSTNRFYIILLILGNNEYNYVKISIKIK